jgi:DNA phosphorothioation-associated putative methyltransferase
MCELAKYNFQKYKEDLEKLQFGKKLPGCIYVHIPDLETLPLQLSRLVERVKLNLKLGDEYTVAKLFTDSFQISYLAYPDFEEIAHPALQKSVSVPLSTGKARYFDYESNENPPILHRKEEMLLPPNSKIQAWRALTLEEELEGLYEDTSVIGFQQNWDSILKSKGVDIQGHEIKRVEGSTEESRSSADYVKRHRTAISRYKFSKPVETLLNNDFLKDHAAFFDFGCGLGDDIQGLQTLGVNAFGWDPYHRSDGKKEKADVVNLGFVLNVIEAPVERLKALKDAFSYAEKLLVVSAMLPSCQSGRAYERYADGVITSRDTFQKYFEHEELRQYIEDALQIPEAIAAAPGVFYIFRSPQDLQAYMERKSRRSIQWSEISSKISPKKVPRKKSLLEKHREFVESFWRALLEHGRIPTADEFPRLQEFTATVCSPKQALRLFISEHGEELLDRASKSRADDLLVYLAIANFRRKLNLRELSPSLRLDIKSFFGTFQKAKARALNLLYSIGNTEVIAELCETSKVGFNQGNGLFLRRDQLELLHPTLRVYALCGEVLYGDIGDVDVIKIHKFSGKVTFQQYDDFEGAVLPELRIRAKISLALRRIHYFDYSEQNRKQLLYHKVRFFDETQPEFKKMERHSKKLESLGFPVGRYGPSKEEFSMLLENLDLTENLYPRRKAN